MSRVGKSQHLRPVFGILFTGPRSGTVSLLRAKATAHGAVVAGRLRVEVTGNAQGGRAADQGKVLDTRLRRYAGHPNYFADACVRRGFLVPAWPDWPGLVTAVGPAAIMLLLTTGPGKPLPEKSIRARRTRLCQIPGTRQWIVPPAAEKRLTKTADNLSNVANMCEWQQQARGRPGGRSDAATRCQRRSRAT
ncbi:DUF1295 domain-containing protein [Actinophytocola sp.]|uniref:DUF1295 domain-containing protein n=1 Tax=Actinophytocola sp. TaxID=1872138 RepID=UPI003899C391